MAILWTNENLNSMLKNRVGIKLTNVLIAHHTGLVFIYHQNLLEKLQWILWGSLNAVKPHEGLTETNYTILKYSREGLRDGCSQGQWDSRCGLPWDLPDAFCEWNKLARDQAIQQTFSLGGNPGSLCVFFCFILSHLCQKWRVQGLSLNFLPIPVQPLPLTCRLTEWGGVICLCQQIPFSLQFPGQDQTLHLWGQSYVSLGKLFSKWVQLWYMQEEVARPAELKRNASFPIAEPYESLALSLGIWTNMKNVCSSELFVNESLHKLLTNDKSQPRYLFYLCRKHLHNPSKKNKKLKTKKKPPTKQKTQKRLKSK